MEFFENFFWNIYYSYDFFFKIEQKTLRFFSIICPQRCEKCLCSVGGFSVDTPLTKCFHYLRKTFWEFPEKFFVRLSKMHSRCPDEIYGKNSFSCKKPILSLSSEVDHKNLNFLTEKVHQVCQNCLQRVPKESWDFWEFSSINILRFEQTDLGFLMKIFRPVCQNCLLWDERKFFRWF